MLFVLDVISFYKHCIGSDFGINCISAIEKNKLDWVQVNSVLDLRTMWNLTLHLWTIIIIVRPWQTSFFGSQVWFSKGFCFLWPKTFWHASEVSGEKLFRADAFFCFGVGLGRGAFCYAVDRLTYSHAPPLLNSSCLTQMGEDSSPPWGGIKVHCKISLLKQLILESIDAAD